MDTLLITQTVERGRVWEQELGDVHLYLSFVSVPHLGLPVQKDSLKMS